MKKRICSPGAVVKIDGGLRAHLISVHPCGENGEFYSFVFSDLLSSAVEGGKNVA
ncbi:MAG: hypothetical protein L3J89_00495 [Gammaproteobacteria bacterium]|nr:hypothetical protein [Gammaproteobacteria bacterium]